MVRAASTVRKTPNFDFIFGTYSHAKWTIPYFQIGMSLGDAASYLRLVNEMPGAASMNWRLEELFQRDIDWSRVQRKIVPYLKQTEQPQFFNSLSIALLPIRNAEIATFADGQTWVAPPLDNPDLFRDGATKQFGPISCGYWSKWTKTTESGALLGQINWNTDQVCGIAIDGQHRLAAIKQVAGVHDLHSKSRVPIILIVLHPELGFSGGNDRGSLIDTLRRLFIDLNKHARTVSRARQILLDDRDPVSICVRGIVGSQLSQGTTELSASPPRLPLSVVDWHTEQAKFDDGPYLTTILGLDWTVARVMGIKPLEDPMSFDEIATLISRLEGSLGIRLADAKDRLALCVKHDRPFAFTEEPQNELSLIASAFVQRWSRPLLELLTGFAPYRSVLAKRKETETLCPEFANWYALRYAADASKHAKLAQQLLDSYEGDLGGRATEPISIKEYLTAIEDIEEIKRDSKLAFTVVFQRALLLAFVQMTKITDAMLSDLGDAPSADLSEVLSEVPEDDASSSDPDNGGGVDTVAGNRATELVAALNHLVERQPEFLEESCEFPVDQRGAKQDRFWLCSLQEPEGNIDFTQAAAKRASDLLLLVGILWLYRTYSSDGLPDSDAIEAILQNPDGTGIEKKLGQCFGRLSGRVGNDSVAERILKAREVRGAGQDDRDEQILARMKWLLEVLGAS